MGIVIAIALLGALFVSDNQEFFDNPGRAIKRPTVTEIKIEVNDNTRV